MLLNASVHNQFIITFIYLPLIKKRPRAKAQIIKKESVLYFLKGGSSSF